MIDRYYIQRLLGGARSSLIGALILVVLIGSLQTVATTAANANQADYTAALPAMDDYLCNYPVAPETSGHQGMTSDSRPITGASSHWILPLIVKTDNTGRRLNLEEHARLSTRAEVVYSRDRESLRTSAFLVCPSLGRQFTLVGAKPSGTS